MSSETASLTDLNWVLKAKNRDEKAALLDYAAAKDIPIDDESRSDALLYIGWDRVCGLVSLRYAGDYDPITADTFRALCDAF